MRNETPRNAAAGQCHRFDPKGCSRCSRLIWSTLRRTCQIKAINQSTPMTGPKISTPKASAGHPRRFSRPQERLESLG
jgi:hypothetical protein